MDEILNFSKVFFPVYIRELLDSPIEIEEDKPVLKIEVNNFTFRVRRIRVVAEASDLREGSRWTDYTLQDGTGEITLRVWHSTSGTFIPFLELENLYIIFGFFKEFKGFRYISPIIIREYNRGDLEAWYQQIELVRKAILKTLTV